MVNLAPAKETYYHVQTHCQDYPNNPFQASPNAAWIEEHTHHSRRYCDLYGNMPVITACNGEERAIKPKRGSPRRQKSAGGSW